MPNRRRIFILNKKFQFRFAFYVCSFLFALSFCYPLILSNNYDFFIHYISRDPNGPSPAYIEAIRNEMMWLVFLMEAVVLSLAFVISLFISHRVAGPIYKLMQFFKLAQEGKMDQKLSFRKNDYFQELAEGFNELMDHTNARLAKKSSAISKAITSLESAINKAEPDTKFDLQTALKELKDSMNA